MDSENENKPGIQSAFTLIERLVVLATTAILAAMPLPALSKAKQKAKAIQCVSNLKQMGLGLILFADDNQDCLPGPLLAGQGSAYNNHSLHQLTYSLPATSGGNSSQLAAGETAYIQAMFCPGYGTFSKPSFYASN